MKELLAVAYSRLKSYRDFYDLAAGTDTHGGTPDPSPGGDNAGCIAEGKLAAGIHPSDAGGKISGENLSIVGVAG